MSIVGLIRAFRRVFDRARHATGSRSSARSRPGRRPRWQQCPGCDERVQSVHPMCSFCAQCCGCRPGRPGGGGEAAEHEEGTAERGSGDDGRFRFSVQDS